MANPEHLAKLKEGVEAWNQWRDKLEAEPDLSGADLTGLDLTDYQLYCTNLSRAILEGVTFGRANLSRTNFHRAIFSHPAPLWGSVLREVNLSEVDLTQTSLEGVDLTASNFSRSCLRRSDLSKSTLLFAQLERTCLREAHMNGADLRGANLQGADLRGASLQRVNLVQTNLAGANLTGCLVYGISAWDLNLEGTLQSNLVITPTTESPIQVDNLEVAQFVYLLLHNEKVRDAIDTIGKKGVLLLGRFTGGRIAVLERLRDELRKRDLMPMVFNFDKPETKDFTETVRLLAGLSRFVIADITNPKSAPLELQATVPEYMIPFVPILERGEEPFAMFRDLWIKHREWVLDPIRYPSVDRLIEVLDAEIVEPAQVRFAELLARKAERLRIKDI